MTQCLHGENQYQIFKSVGQWWIWLTSACSLASSWDKSNSKSRNIFQLPNNLPVWANSSGANSSNSCAKESGGGPSALVLWTVTFSRPVFSTSTQCELGSTEPDIKSKWNLKWQLVYIQKLAKYSVPCSIVNKKIKQNVTNSLEVDTEKYYKDIPFYLMQCGTLLIKEINFKI